MYIFEDNIEVLHTLCKVIKQAFVKLKMFQLRRTPTSIWVSEKAQNTHNFRGILYSMKNYVLGNLYEPASSAKDLKMVGFRVLCGLKIQIVWEIKHILQ